MNQDEYGKLLERYKNSGLPEVIGEPGHKLITSLLSIWRKNDYPERFKIGNYDLSLECGIGPSNIPKLRDRVLELCKLDYEYIITYRSMGRAQPGLYEVNPALNKDVVKEVSEEVVEPEIKSPVPQTTRQAKKAMWERVPFAKLPELKDVDISTLQAEKLNNFGIRHLRPIDQRYYTPATDDMRLLYELFRHYSPQSILDKAKVAKRDGVNYFLTLMVEEGARSEG